MNKKKIRIISKIEIKGENVVKGRQMEGLRVVGTPKDIILNYYKDGVDEIILNDIVASLYGRNHLVSLVDEISREIFIPLVVGGGIRNLNDIERLLKVGADKVCFNTAAVKNPKIINEAAKFFGSQCIVVEVQAKFRKSHWEVFTENGRERSYIDVNDWLKTVESEGAGEIILTSIDHDGCMNGLSSTLYKNVSDKNNIPVIAAGGAGKIEHVEQILLNKNIDAVALSTSLHKNLISIKSLKNKLSKQKFDLRLS